MKIIGGHDYYDSAIQYGIDDTIVFVREKDKYVEGGPKPPQLYLCLEDEKGKYISNGSKINTLFGIVNGIKANGIDFAPIHIIFCGKIYSGLWTDRQYIWNFKDLLKLLKVHSLDLPKEKYLSSFWSNERDSCYSLMEKYFIPKDCKDWAISNNVTIAIYREIKSGMVTKLRWHINQPELRKFQFYKVFDPFTTFQEISMWVGGVLANQGNKMVEITDNNMKIRKAGHDPKVSFRKAKES